jgi:uncharacterized protein YndB with AHSA1/START domain
MLAKHIGADFRAVADREWDGKPAKAVVAGRVYDTDPADLWDALTNPQRLPRWFAPVTGAFELGGRIQIEGNAACTILRCDAAEALDVTWEFAGGMSWVTLRLAPEGRGTRLTLEHIVALRDLDGEHWQKFGPAAVGVGWDLSFLGLGLHLAGAADQPPEADPAWGASDEGRAFMNGSADAWAAAHIASGEPPDVARRMAAETARFYTGG